MSTAIAAVGGDAETSAANGTYVPTMALWFLRSAAIYLLLVKLAFSLLVPPNADEAYYWIWGQHLQWSYLDHAPLVGWGSWLGNQVLGWGIPAMRFTPLLSFAGIIWMIWVWAKRLAPAHAEHYFWACLAIWLASPLMNALTSLVYPDQILIFLSTVSLFFFSLFLADWRAGKRDRYRDLYLGALFLGLAGLGKYNAVFIAAGLVAVILINRRMWPLLRSPHLWAAGALTLLIVSPIIWWNAYHDFPTLKLHAIQRFENRGGSFRLSGIVRVLQQSALYLSPLLLWGLARFLLVRRLGGLAAQLQGLGRGTFVFSTGFMLSLAAWGAAASQVAPHWNDLAFVPFMLAAPLFVRSRWLIGIHVMFGALVATIATVYYVSAPVLTDALGIGDGEARYTYGQDQVATAARQAKADRGADFYAIVRYTTASKFAFGLGTDKDIVTLTEQIDQFDFWRNPDDYAGKTAIVVLDRGTSEDAFARYFESYELIGPVHATRYGHPLFTYNLYLARGYKPSQRRP